MQEVHDPQDDAVLSNDMSAPKVEQITVPVQSVYEGLVEIAKTGAKLFRTNGRHSNMMKFDFITHSVCVGNLYIIHNGNIVVDTLETAAKKINLAGLPLLSQDEKMIDPIKLFNDHYHSCPNGSEVYMMSNFDAKNVDDMSDDEIAKGMPRGEARIRLEAWILCAAIDGTLEKYVTSKPDWKPDFWYWSPCNGGDAKLVIKKEWWEKSRYKDWGMLTWDNGQTAILINQKTRIILPNRGVEDCDKRVIQKAPKLLALLKSMSQEAFRLERRLKRNDMEQIICEANRLIDYIESGKEVSMH